MAHLFSYWDESGKDNQPGFIVFNGLVDFMAPWQKFSEEWLRLLRQYKLTEFHAVKALRYSQPYGTMEASDGPEQRLKDVLPFVNAITCGVEVGVIVVVDTAAYQATDAKLHKKFGRDPHYFAFYNAVSLMMQHWRVPEPLTVGMILDDEEKKSRLCYDLWVKLRKLVPEARQRLTSICFGDDKANYPLQAVDLFAYLSRLDAERKFLNKPYPYRSLFEELANSRFDGRRLKFMGGLYGAKEITEYIRDYFSPAHVSHWESV